MINLKRKLLTALATGAILANALTPIALADTNLEITGNGASSNNTETVNTTTTTTVVQNNNANITNTINSNATTGDNNANDNTGGDVNVNTGDASSDISVSNQANLNEAQVQDCNGCNTDANVKISGNGASSTNTANLTNTNTTDLFQDNQATIRNDITANQQTGNNDANRNTGGNVSIRTGNAGSMVDVANAANANIARIGSGGTSSGGTINAEITGNGADSRNSIDLTNTRSVVVVQDNNADIRNRIRVSAETGNNDANDNTGGDTSIDTGDAWIEVGVDNMFNFNAADVSCCQLDVTGKISGNGAESRNDIRARLANVLDVFQGGRESQGNLARIENILDPNARTGGNDADRNTGPVLDDPTSVMTGDASFTASVSNSGNVNIFGEVPDLHLPDISGIHFDFSFSLSELMALLHASMV